jgi:hypothetical protein
MAFVRKKVSTFKWPVTVQEPADGGAFDPSTFEATFKRMGRKEFTKLSTKGDLPLLKALVLDWSGIKEEDGTEIPFSTETLTEFVDDPYWVRGVLSAYTDTFEGAREGN